MTHLIENWHRPHQIKAVQTTNNLNTQPAFDLHPKQADPQSISQMVQQFNLPHAPSFLHQVHGNQIIEYTKQPSTQLTQQADACFTRNKEIICAVMTADCLPVLLTDNAGSFVAAVHCGWRSLFTDILTNTLEKINSDQPILAWFGPCIQPAQYEVDEPFVHYYLDKHPNSQAAFTAIKSGKSTASLYKLASIQLNALGVQNIQTANQCTFLNPEFYSWRQNKSPQRMASMLWLNSKSNAQ